MEPLDTDAVTTVDDLGRLLRQLRRREARERGDSEWTYRELAARTGWSLGSIAGYLDGKTLPPTERFDTLVQLLGATSTEQGLLATIRDRVDELRRAPNTPATSAPTTGAPTTRAAEPADEPPLTDSRPTAGLIGPAVPAHRLTRRTLLLALPASAAAGAGLMAARACDRSPQAELEVSRDTVPPVVDLTAVGTLGWAHWGYLPSDLNNPAQFVGNPVPDDCTYNIRCLNHMKAATIIDYLPIGNVEPFRLRARGSPVRYIWTNGVPTSRAAGVQAGEYMALRGNGFRLSVPATMTPRTLILYAGVYQGKAALRARMEPNGPSVEDATFNTFGTFDEGHFTAYQLKHRGSRSNQKLIVELTLAEDIGGGNVTLFAAALRDN